MADAGAAKGLTVGYRPLVLGAALGLLHAATFAPWGSWWAQLVVLAAFSALVLSMILRGHGARRPALTGMLFGFGWFVAGVGWLYVSMHTYGLMPAPLALLALALFALYLSLFPAAAVGLTAALHARWAGNRGADAEVPFALLAPVFALTLAAALTLGDLLRGTLLTGFPWLAVGYGQTDGPLAGYAAVVGSYGVGFAACLVGGLAGGLLAALPTALRSAALRSAASPTIQPTVRPRVRPGAVVAASLVPALALLLVGQGLKGVAWSEPTGAALKVRLLQGNVPQLMKFDPVVARQTMQRYLELVAAEPADLIVLPETAWTVPWASTPADVVERLERFVSSSGSAVAIGLPLTTRRKETGGAGDRGDSTVALTNSVLLFDPEVMAGRAPPPRYDKHHLVPFGEFVPWGFRWFVDLMTIPLGDFGRGSVDQAPFAVRDQRVAFNICYEDVFGEELLPSLTRGAGGATILANISNIAWFGDSHALPQHLQIARMRTLETARPMIRATNTGVTGAIDFDGSVLATLPPYHLGALSVMVQGRSGLTPFAQTGNWPIAAACLLILAAAFLAGMRSRDKRAKPAKIPA